MLPVHVNRLLTPFRVHGHPLPALFTVVSGGFFKSGVARGTPFPFSGFVVDLLCFLQDLVDKGKVFPKIISVFSSHFSLSCRF